MANMIRLCCRFILMLAINLVEVLPDHYVISEWNQREVLIRDLMTKFLWHTMIL